MSKNPENYKATVIHAVEAAWNEGDLDALDQVYDAGLVHHEPPFPDQINLATYKEWIATTRVSYPDSKLVIEEMIKVGNTAATRWTWRGTHTVENPATRIPPTGKQVELMGCSIGHLEGDLTVEEWTHGDYLGMFQQLGVIPALEPEAE